MLRICRPRLGECLLGQDIDLFGLARLGAPDDAELAAEFLFVVLHARPHRLGVEFAKVRQLKVRLQALP